MVLFNFPPRDVLWRFPEFRSSLLCISFLWEDKQAWSPRWSALTEGGRDGEKRGRRGRQCRLGFHSYFFPSELWIGPKSFSWATVWIGFYPHLSAPTFPVLTCLCFIFQGGNKRQPARKYGRSLLDELSRARKLHTQKVSNWRLLDASIFCHLTGVQLRWCVIRRPSTHLSPLRLCFCCLDC